MYVCDLGGGIEDVSLCPCKLGERREGTWSYSGVCKSRPRTRPRQNQINFRMVYIFQESVV